MRKRHGLDKVLALLFSFALVFTSTMALFPASQAKANPIEWGPEHFTFDGQTITGFSESGVEFLKTNSDLVLPNVTDEGETVTAIGVRAFSLINYPGQPVAGRITSLSLPEGLTTIGFAAFFNSEIEGEVVIPPQVKVITKAAFRNNRLSKVVFSGDVETIEDLAFAENYLTEVEIPKSLKTFGENTFAVNYGLEEYENHVVLWTPDRDNPNNLADFENVYIDPGDDKKVSVEPVENPDVWEPTDFEWSGTTVTGLSQVGERKVKTNKELIIPETTPSGEAVTEVADEAFRGLKGTKKLYHLTSVSVPDSVTHIGKWAFQFNNIESAKLPADLETISWGILMNNRLTHIEIPEGVDVIGKMAFRGNELENVTIPASVKEIESNAFETNQLNSVGFADGSALEIIHNNAFADNRLVSITIPDSVSTILYNAFINNPGDPSYGEPGKHPVVVKTESGDNPNSMPDDLVGSFIVEPETKAKDEEKSRLLQSLNKANGLLNDGKDLYNDDYYQILTDAVAEGQAVYNDGEAYTGKVNGAIQELEFLAGRAELDKIIKRANGFDTDDYTDESRSALQKAIKDGMAGRLTFNISDQKVTSLVNKINSAIKTMVKKGDTPDYQMTKGEAPVYIKHIHHISDYMAKLIFHVDAEGRLIDIVDDGTGDKLKEDHHTEEHDFPYWNNALLGMGELLRGKTLEEVSAVTAQNVSKATIFDSHTGATVSGLAIRDAAITALGGVVSEKVMVHFDSNGGSDVPDVAVDIGTPVNEPETPSKEGHVFVGWFAEDEAFDFAKAVNEETFLSAKWKMKRTSSSGSTVSYKPDDEKEPEKPSEADKEEPEKPSQTEEPNKPAEPSQTSQDRFIDISDHWAKDVINRMAEQGLVAGRSANRYAPDENVTRAEYLAFLMRLCEGKGLEGIPVFSDVSADAWYATTVNWGVHEKLIAGIGNNRFAPNQAINRQDAAVLIERYLAYKGITPEKVAFAPFADMGEVSPYAVKAVNHMQEIGLFKGRAGNVFDPQSPFSRGEMAAILDRLVGLEKSV